MVAYTIRDVDKTINEYIVNKKFRLPQNGKNIPVPVYMGTPDEFLAQKTYPCIFIEPGYDVFVDPQWQAPETAVLEAHPTDPVMAVKTTTKTTDILYSLKISAYTTFSDHLTTLILWLAQLFPLDSCVEGVTESKKEEFCFPLVWDGQIINLDEQNSLVKMAMGLSASQLGSDTRVYRRDIVVTAHLQTDNATVENQQIILTGLRLLWNNE